MAATNYNAYPIFEKNQVLTNTQLNQLVSYLEEQGRLTRSSLIGIGIVCGLELKFVPEADAETGVDTLYISEGVGISSEGFLISFCGCPITKYRNFVLNPYVDYPAFQNPATKQQDIVIQELLTDDFENDGSEEPIEQMDAEILKDKVVVLFLECYDKDLKSCLSKSCDDIGIERRFTLRKLLISKTDIENKVLVRNGNEETLLFPERYALPDVAVKMPLFSPPVTDFNTFGKVAGQYGNILFAATSDPVTAVLTALKDAYHAYQPVLQDAFSTNPFNDPVTQVTAWKALFDGSGDATKYMGIQYYYDFVKDLMLTYDEFRRVSFDLLTKCCPDNKRFPKHLLLGEVIESCTPSEYRQQFIQTPVYNAEGKLLKETISLFSKAAKMVTEFNTKRVNSVESYGPLKIKITPSHEKISHLSVRAMPYYFNVKKKGTQGTLEELWSYEIRRKCKVGGGLLGYENNFDDLSGGPAVDTPVSKPLAFDRDAFDFFRVEGGLGKPADEVLNTVEEKIYKYNIPMDVIGVRVNEATLPVITDALKDGVVDYNKGFHDLHEDYVTFRYQIADMFKTALGAWDLFQRIEKMLQETDPDYKDPIPEEVRKIIEEVYKGIVEFLCRTLPPCLPDFAKNFEELKDRYADAIVYVTDKVFEHLELDAVDETANDVNEKTGLNLAQDVIAEATRLVWQIFDNFFYNRLHRIYYAFRRREYYLALQFNKHSYTFAEYVAKHPGIAHMAGAPTGGTYIVLYGNFLGMSQRVLADFALPYRCCGEEHAIPVCDDEQARANIQVAPYARPDYGYTFRNTSIEMDLVLNDHELYDLEKEYCAEDVKSTYNLRVVRVEPMDKNGFVEILEDERHIRFTPEEGFTGIAKFRYTLEKISNKLTDEGIVTILVRNQCVKLVDFDFTMRAEDTVVASLENFPGYLFNDPDVDQNLLEIGNKGEVMTITLLQDIQDSYSFKYSATGQENNGCGTITIHPAANNGPVIDNQEILTEPVAEQGAIIGTVVAFDPDNEPLTYVFESGATDIYNIDPESGEVRVINPDAMKQGVYQMGVRVTDPFGLFDTAILTIRVVLQNEAPQIQDQSFDVLITAQPGTVVNTVEAFDPDGDPLTFSIAAGNIGNAFKIGASTGQLVVASNSNFGNIQQFVLTIRVADTKGAAATGNVIVNIIRTNQPPTVTLVEPKAGTIFAAGAPINAVFQAADNSKVVRVDVFLNGQLVGATTEDKKYVFTLPDLNPGSYTLAGRAVDDEGATASTPLVNFEVQKANLNFVNDNLDLLTAEELNLLLETRKVKTAATDTRGSLQTKLKSSISTTPLTRTELTSLSDATIRELATRAGLDSSAKKTVLIDQLLSL
ncbi:MAG: cadherin domain-containing protein [Flavobacteriales bacterium]|nr:cadherin domain-containing protein [Flavobacteriales bacterium]MCB9448604.1 cadherin domain-containing protein [Flavobacteriales bacterium]